MQKSKIPIDKILVKAHDLWTNQWFLLTSGDFEKRSYNTMTVAWGSLGVMWNKPFVQVVVRPTRYTFKFMEQYDTFTLCAFSEEYRRALQILGIRSGRDGDKISEAGLTPIASSRIAAPSFAEAELIFECEKIYWDDFDPKKFLDPAIDRNYPHKDYHRIYYGEVVEILGTDVYQA